MVRPGTTIDEVRTVASHNHGIAQTRNWIARHLPHADVLVSTSTSEAAAQVARGEIDAAVCAPLAAAQFGLEILADDVADNPGAVTRFVLLTPPGPPPAATGHDRTTLAATTQNRPGSLLGLLTELAVRGIDLTRIESRPIKDRHAEYWFHLDCTGHIAEPAMGEALAALHRRCDRVRFLGSYPRAGEHERHGTGRRRAGRPRARHRRRRRSRPPNAGSPACARERATEARAGPARTHGGQRGPRPGQPPARRRRSTSSAARRRTSSPAGWPATRSAPCTPRGRSGRSRPRPRWPPRTGSRSRCVDGVHEVSVGDLEGRSDEAALEAFFEVYDAWWRGELDARLPGGESALDLRARFLPAVERIVGDGDGDVVLVSHGAAIRMAAGGAARRHGRDLVRAQRRPGGAAPRAAGLGAGGVGHGRAGAQGRHRGRRAGLSGAACRAAASAATRVPCATRVQRAGPRSPAFRYPKLLRYADRVRAQPQPSRCRVSSSIPKWCATSCTTVTATSSTTSSSSTQTSRIASR